MGIYAICSTIGPWNVGDYIPVHSPLNVEPECWQHLRWMYERARHWKHHFRSFAPYHGELERPDEIRGTSERDSTPDSN